MYPVLKTGKKQKGRSVIPNLMRSCIGAGYSTQYHELTSVGKSRNALIFNGTKILLLRKDRSLQLLGAHRAKEITTG